MNPFSTHSDNALRKTTQEEVTLTDSPFGYDVTIFILLMLQHGKSVLEIQESVSKRYTLSLSQKEIYTFMRVYNSQEVNRVLTFIASKIAESMSPIVNILYQNVTHELLSRDLTRVKTENLFKIASELILKSRLLGDKSTANVAVLTRTHNALALAPPGALVKKKGGDGPPP